jgi:flagellar biosynthetic protein FliR
MIVLSEAILGLTIALLVHAVTDIFAFAGAVMDIDIGFNASSEYDPSGETRTILSYLLVQMFVVCFLVTDMHLEMLKIAAFSFQTLPPGGFVLDGQIVELVLRAMHSIFLVGIQVAMPVMAAIFMINIGMGILARIGEDFPVMILAFAIHLGVGILVFGAIIPSTLEICRSSGLKLLEGLLFIISEV